MTRKLLLILTASTFFFQINAQLNKGTLLLGGDVSFFTNTFRDGNVKSETNNITFSPVLARAVRQNIFWGGSLSLGTYKNESATSSSTHNTFYGAGIFYRGYKPVSKKFYAFLQAGLAAGLSKDKFRQGPDYYYDEKRVNTGLNITPGISYAVTKKLFLESGFNSIASLNYTHSETSGYNFGNFIDRSSSGIAFTSSLAVFANSLYFGFRFMME
jgi:hypothetical protein